VITDPIASVYQLPQCLPSKHCKYRCLATVDYSNQDLKPLNIS